MTDEQENPPEEDSASSAPRRRPAVWRVVAMLFLVWVLLAYVLLPFAWRLVAPHHPAIEGMPTVAVTGSGLPGDPLNIALVGTEEDVERAILDAGWLPADPITLRSCLRIAAGTVLRRAYDTAPVSNLFVWGRKQDLAFQQPVGRDPRRRHHVRFWRSEEVDQQRRPLWVGSATFDTRVGLSRTTAQLTHHIDANVDAERDKLLGDLRQAGALEQVDWIDGFHTTLQSRNGGGDPWYTDGRLAVAYLIPDRRAVTRQPPPGETDEPLP